MESAVIPSMYLLPQWFTRLLEECSEGDPDELLGVKCLRGQGRVVLWSMCVDMGVNLHGIPGQACRLLERFLATQLRQFHQQTMTEEGWQEAKRRVLTHLPLLMASCVQLAVKMSCADIPMSANVGRAFLGSRGVYYSIEEIKESEYNVFRMLGFRLPLWTSVDAGEALAVFLGMPLAMLQPVAHFVNLMELYRDKLELRVRWAAAPTSGSSAERPDLNNAFLPTLHLVAGAVVACARCRPCSGPQPVPNPGPRLAELLRVPLCYIRCLADAIISTIMEGDSPKKRFSDFREDSDNPRKRRREQAH